MNPIREIPCDIITDTVKNLFIEASTDLGEDVLSAIKSAAESEDSELGRYALDKIIENARIAKDSALPLCQDTGLAVVFVELGQDVHITGGDFNEAVQEGVRRAYRDGFLRKSVCDPISRENTGDNTPAVIHTDIVKGDRIRIIAMPKGGGIREHIVDMVEKAGPNPCPPVIVGAGIGGSIEKSALLAKKALLRPLGEPSRSDPRLSRVEKEPLDELNRLGTGPQGYG
ncbi:MAG: fumarate hydratase, partial [Deltaproteobacteria bacterium]|nr:fumarate hydratase [Deltaproteobacteria bacterium]